MSDEVKKLLFDIRECADAITTMTAGRTAEDLDTDRPLRSAIYWEFAVIGEAMTRLRRDHPEIAARITEDRRIVQFRNQLIRGYDVVRSEVVWRIAHDKLAVLKVEVEALLSE